MNTGKKWAEHKKIDRDKECEERCKCEGELVPAKEDTVRSDSSWKWKISVKWTTKGAFNIDVQLNWLINVQHSVGIGHLDLKILICSFALHQFCLQTIDRPI